MERLYIFCYLLVILDKFQKNLVVWKAVLYYFISQTRKLFQKNLVVWKVKIQITIYGHGFEVSEELSSVESKIFKMATADNLKVSEELSSVESWKDFYYRNFNKPTLFQKNLVVWKAIYFIFSMGIYISFQKNLVVWKDFTGY